MCLGYIHCNHLMENTYTSVIHNVIHSANRPSLFSFDDLEVVWVGLVPVTVAVIVGRASAAAALSAKNFSNSLLVSDSSGPDC